MNVTPRNNPMRTSWNNVLLLCLFVCSCSYVNSFVSFSSSIRPNKLSSQRQQPQQPQQQSRRHRLRTFLVSEEDVLESVEHAEQLWAEALEARKTANALSDRAEEEAEAASSSAKEVEEKMKDRSKPISMETLAEGDAVARSSLDAGSMLNTASDEADRLLAEAELALQKSEERLDQHLEDFPDSPLKE
jgi:glycerol-3-phosphate O-acyltransferase